MAYVGGSSSKTNAPLMQIEQNFNDFAEDLVKMKLYGVNLSQALMQLGGTKNCVFTRAGAVLTKGTILTTIRMQGKGDDSASVNWPALDEDYEKWKEDKYGTTDFWSLSNKLKSSIVVRKASNGGWEAGIDKRSSVPRIQYKGKGKSIKVWLYASTIEFGAGRQTEKRPLFAPSIQKVLQKDYPDLVNLMQKALDQATVMMAPKYKSSKAHTTANPDLIMGGALDRAGGELDAVVADIGNDVRASGKGFQNVADPGFARETSTMKWSSWLEKQLQKLLSGVTDPAQISSLTAWAKGDIKAFKESLPDQGI